MTKKPRSRKSLIVYIIIAVAVWAIVEAFNTTDGDAVAVIMFIGIALGTVVVSTAVVFVPPSLQHVCARAMRSVRPVERPLVSLSETFPCDNARAARPGANHRVTGRPSL